MKVRFYIEKRRGEDGRLLIRERPVFMTVAFHGKRVLISTGVKVDLQSWDIDKQQVREIHPDAVEINSWLKALEHTAGVVWKALASLSVKPGVEVFREEFEKLRPRFSGGFFDVMIMFMEEGSLSWSTGTYKKVRTFYSQIRDFEKESGVQLSFNNINADFLFGFREYLQRKKLAEFTVLKTINTLVWFLNWASKKGFNVYTDYRSFYKMLDQPKKTGVGDVLFLDWDELMLFFNYETEEPRKKRIIDVFCIMCFTGLRFSEVRNMQREDVDDKYLFIRKKSGEGRKIPLNKYAEEIIRNYKNRYYRDNLALPPVSAVTMNKYLGIVGRELKLNRMVHKKSNEKKVPINEALTAGIAVQTFIMNAIRLDIPADIISLFTGVSNDIRVMALQNEMAKKQMNKFNNI